MVTSLVFIALLPGFANAATSTEVPKAYMAAAGLIPEGPFLVQQRFLSKRSYVIEFSGEIRKGRVSIPWVISVDIDGRVFGYSVGGKSLTSAEISKSKSKVSPLANATINSLRHMAKNGIQLIPAEVTPRKSSSGGFLVRVERLPVMFGGWSECELDKSAKITHLRRGQ